LRLGWSKYTNNFIVSRVHRLPYMNVTVYVESKPIARVC